MRLYEAKRVSGLFDFVGAVSMKSGLLRWVTSRKHLRAGGPALVDVAHWVSEHPWCAQAAGVQSTLPDVTTRVGALRTDPWTLGEYGE